MRQPALAKSCTVASANFFRDAEAKCAHLRAILSVNSVGSNVRFSRLRRAAESRLKKHERIALVETPGRALRRESAAHPRRSPRAFRDAKHVALCSPLRHSLLRERLKKVTSPLDCVAAEASAFMKPSIELARLRVLNDRGKQSAELGEIQIHSSSKSMHSVRPNKNPLALTAPAGR